jgi:hypothetical protein
MKHELKAVWGLIKWFAELIIITIKVLVQAAFEVVFTDGEHATRGLPTMKNPPPPPPKQSFEVRQMRRNQEFLRQYQQKKL